jgi:hypothetical protein
MNSSSDRHLVDYFSKKLTRRSSLVARVVQQTGVPRSVVWSTFGILESLGAGTRVVGRRGGQSRFVWRMAPSRAAKMLSRMVIERDETIVSPSSPSRGSGRTSGRKARLAGVRQLDSTGCGVAIVATLAGVSYTQAKQVMFPSGSRGRGFRTGWRDLRVGLEAFGVRFRGLARRTCAWEDVPDVAVVLVNQKPTGGHWVVFVRDAERPFVLDPNSKQPGCRRTDIHRTRPHQWRAVEIRRQ